MGSQPPFQSGVGDTPVDYYVVYADPGTHQVKLVYYIITYSLLRAGKPVDDLEVHAIVYDKWQQSSGLLLPQLRTFYNWADDAIQGEPLGSVEFFNVEFSMLRPRPAMFGKPDDAVVATSHLAGE